MTVFYLDSSAWVKYYVVEAGTGWIDRFWNLRPPCACSDLGLIEVLATLARRQKQKAALTGSYAQAILDVQRQFAAFSAIPMDANVLAWASDVANKHALRGADCIHLASAIHMRDLLGVTIVMIGSDAELLAATSLEGIATLDPNNNPPLPVIP